MLAPTSMAWAATAAFTGKVTTVKQAVAKQKDTLTHFTVEIVAMNSESLRLASPTCSHKVAIEQDALFQVDGVPANLQSVIKKGGDLVVYPKRGRTIIAFAPIDLK